MLFIHVHILKNSFIAIIVNEQSPKYLCSIESKIAYFRGDKTRFTGRFLFVYKHSTLALLPRTRLLEGLVSTLVLPNSSFLSSLALLYMYIYSLVMMKA